jgi:hypothetical protein
VGGAAGLHFAVWDADVGAAWRWNEGRMVGEAGRVVYRWRRRNAWVLSLCRALSFALSFGGAYIARISMFWPHDSRIENGSRVHETACFMRRGKQGDQHQTCRRHTCTNTCVVSGRAWRLRYDWDQAAGAFYEPMKRAHEMAGPTHAVVRCKSNQIKTAAECMIRQVSVQRLPVSAEFRAT